MFLEVISRYMAEGYMHFGEGEIEFGKERIAFNFLPILAREFIMNSEMNPNTYSAISFISARYWGSEYIKRHAIPLVKSWTPVLRLSFELMNLFGGGSYRSVKADNKQGFIVATGRSTFALEMKAEGPSPDPVDSLVGGLLAGSIQHYMKKPIYAVETSCVAQKDISECTWVAGDRQSIMAYIQKFSPNMVGQGNKTLDQIESIEKKLREGGEEKWLV